MGVRIEGVKRDRACGDDRLGRALAAASRDGQRSGSDGKSPPMKTIGPARRYRRFVRCLGLALSGRRSARARPGRGRPARRRCPHRPPTAAPEAPPPRDRARAGVSARLSLRSAAARLLLSPVRYRAMPYAYPGAPPAVESMEGFHTHDGLYMRVHVGIAATGFSSTQAGVKTNYSGGGSSTGIAIGGVIAHNLILYGDGIRDRHLEPRQADRRRQLTERYRRDRRRRDRSGAWPTTSST